MPSSRRLGRAPIDLSGLSPDELRAVRTRADALLGATPAADPKADRPSDAAEEIVSAVVRQLIDRGSTVLAPVPVMRRAPWWPKMEAGAAVVASYLTTHAPTTMAKRNARRRAYSIVVGVLIRWLERVRVPVTPRTVALNLDKVPAIMDQQFPGYAANGLLEWVFRPR